MKRLRIAVDLATGIAAIAIVAMAGRAFLLPLMVDAPGSIIEDHLSTGLQLEGAALGVDFTDRTTLIMALQSDCGYCRESMPFYRRLLTQDRAGGVQVVVAAPARDTGISDYLASEGVTPDAVVLDRAGELPVSGTPTLLVVDSDGVVTHSWIGLLDAERESEVLGVLFGDA